VLSKRTSGRPSYARLGGVEVGEGFPVRVVGVINVSPESFYGGSVAVDRRAVQRLARRLVAEGADILDIGAMSTAPYVKGAVSEAEESRRMTAAVRAVRAAVDVPLSADTQRGGVAAAALEAGAQILNDVSGLSYDPALAPLVRAVKGLILMASEAAPSAEPPLAMIARRLRDCVRRAIIAGVEPERIVLDPGIGFFRHAALPWHQLDCAVLRDLRRLLRLGRPLLVGVSRKSFIGKLTGRADVAQRLAGSLAAAAIAVYNGAALIRAHDVAATVDVVRVAQGIRDVVAPGGRR